MRPKADRGSIPGGRGLGEHGRVAHAAQLIREGAADVMVTGGTDAPVSPVVVACFDAIKATTPRNDDPARACRPPGSPASSSAGPPTRAAAAPRAPACR